MRRAFAATLVLLLTGAPVVAAACALACPMPEATSAVAAIATDMPADCAAMHHAGAEARPVEGSGAAGVSRSSAPMPGCCAIAAASIDLPLASVAPAAPLAASVPLVATAVARVAVVHGPARGAAPPGLARHRARRTDILRL